MTLSQSGAAAQGRQLGLGPRMTRALAALSWGRGDGHSASWSLGAKGKPGFRSSQLVQGQQPDVGLLPQAGRLRSGLLTLLQPLPRSPPGSLDLSLDLLGARVPSTWAFPNPACSVRIPDSCLPPAGAPLP